MKNLITILVLLSYGICNGQKQGNIWYFGNHAGLDFNTGAPVALTNGQTYLQSGHLEGTSVISDSSGALLFYSDGENIWNKNHQVMPNGAGIYGSFSTTQSSLIIPIPGQQRFFYLFTLDAFIHDLLYGFRYSKVDMCLDNKLGDVVLSQKNILLLDTAGEKLTGVRHANGIDYWVIVHKYFSDAFYAYLVSSGGISSPIISHVGSVHTSNSPHPIAAIGYVKASPDGSKLALVSTNGGNLRELFDFDKTTGIVSNFINLHTTADSTHDSYGVSFSPDNSKLYMSWNLKVLQYDLSAGGGNPVAIRNSKTTVNPLSPSNNYGIQLGPDGKIYVAEYGAPFLSVINNPNVSGTACNYVSNAVSLAGNNCNFGLPNFIDAYGYSNTTVICETGVGTNNAINIKDRVDLFPNPFVDELSITTDNNEAAEIILYDETGRKVLEQPFTASTTIRTAHLAKGIYFYTVVNRNGIINTGKGIKE